jgi:hypothetical protein
MDLHEHVAVAAPLSAALLLAGGGPAAAVAFFVGAVLVDVDHLLDYWRETGFNLELRRFLTYFDSRCPRHLLLAWHGWEWPALLGALGLALDLPAWLGALVAGWFVHLVLDQRFNPLTAPAYFFLYRWAVGFEVAPLYIPLSR